ncbi:MAG: hypothetical protein IKK26_01180 [Clostridia bacterium]|nr:hypothetical protein [Clostridia bacterium]
MLKIDKKRLKIDQKRSKMSKKRVFLKKRISKTEENGVKDDKNASFICIFGKEGL